jgi:Tfp pilus assembly protein PilO
MKLHPREKKFVAVALLAMVLFVLLQYVLLPRWDRRKDSRDDLLLAQRELRRRRELLAAGNSLRNQAETLQARLAEQEGRLWTAQDTNQAGAQLQAWLVQRVAEQQLELVRSDFLPPSPVGDAYVRVPVQLELNGRVTQLIQFFGSIKQGDKAVALDELQISSGGGKEKRVRCVVVIAGLMAKAG